MKCDKATWPAFCFPSYLTYFAFSVLEDILSSIPPLDVFSLPLFLINFTLKRNVKITYQICQTSGITSLTGSLTTFKGEPKLEGPALCFTTRGEPDVLLGERGGAVPAGNMEGNELLEAFGLEQFPGTFKGAPDFASLSSDVTYTFSN